MDIGSQRSHITDEMKTELTLISDGDGEQSMTILTFGSTQGEKRVCAHVRIGLKLRDGQDKILILFSVPTICEPLASYSVVKSHEMYPQ